MTMFKRGACLLICLLMCVTVLASCKTNGDDGKGSVETNVQGDGAAFSTVRRQDYVEYEFKIMYFFGQDGHDNDFDAEKLTGEVLNDKVYAKDLMVKEAYNISLTLDTMPSAELNTYIRNNSMVGDSPYDVYGINRNSMSLCCEGYFLDLTTLEDIDITQEWWDQKWIDSMAIHGSLFSLVGDFSIGTLQCLSCLCFNKDLFSDRHLTYPYELVESGEWTYEKMLEYVKGVSVDLDEDYRYTAEDFYGITGWATEASYSLFYGSGFTFVKKDNKDALEISYSTDTLTDVYNYVYRIWNTENNFRLSGADSLHSQPWDIFKDDRALFLDTTLLKIGMFLSDMEANYGIIPTPKFNAQQQDYSSYSSYTIPMTCVPLNTADPQRTGNIIEAFCTASYDNVTPDIFEIVTKLQNVKDPESAKMVDIIIRTKMFDPALWYDIPGYGTLCRAMLNSDSTNISSYIKGYAKNAPTKLKEINDLYLDAKNKK